MGEDWGPWIEHDGKGTPPEVIGQYVQLVGTEVQAEYTIRKPYPGFDWTYFRKRIPGGGVWDKVIRYRIRKPAALQTLIGIAASPAPLTERVDA